MLLEECKVSSTKGVNWTDHLRLPPSQILIYACNVEVVSRRDKNALRSKANRPIVLIFLIAVTLTFISEVDLDMIVTYLHTKN